MVTKQWLARISVALEAHLAMEDVLSLFQSIGLSEAKAKDTVKNSAVSNSLKELILAVCLLV